MKFYIVLFIAALIIIGSGFGIEAMMGAGGFKRMVTLTGVYSICKPDKYDVVCFLDADGKEGGLFCMPLSLAGGECKK